MKRRLLCDNQCAPLPPGEWHATRNFWGYDGRLVVVFENEAGFFCLRSF